MQCDCAKASGPLQVVRMTQYSGQQWQWDPNGDLEANNQTSGPAAVFIILSPDVTALCGEATVSDAKLEHETSHSRCRGVSSMRSHPYRPTTGQKYRAHAAGEAVTSQAPCLVAESA